MLLQMRIQNLGVIDDAVLDLSPGLNVLTGETGAGKTMVVSGLALLLGARADAGLVRSGADAALVEGVVDVPPEHASRRRVEEAGGDASDDLILVRSVSAQGRSRAHVGGRSAPVTVLGELGEMLVAVHGQADQWRLRRPEAHRQMLDDFGGDAVAGPRAAYARAHEHHAALVAELARVRGLERDRALESEVLRSGLEELERVEPLAGEDEQLRVEDERLANADGLRAAAQEAHVLLTGGDDLDGPAGGGAAADALARAATALAGGAEHDPELEALRRRAEELGYLAADLGTDVAGYLAGVDVDPARLAWVQGRRAELSRLTRTYGDTIDEVLAWGQRAAARLVELDGAQDRAVELEAELGEARERLGAAAAALTTARTEAAGRLAERVTQELAHLAMGSAALEVAVEDRPAEDGLAVPGREGPVRFGPHGVDDVEIRLAANRGAPARSVAKAASGGELSRVMLALEVVTGGGEAGEATRTPTFVFDEVDAGVGGRAALDIGARLAALARHAQVVVVTHLAQVAAYADRHLVVHKSDDGQVTSSGVRGVEGDERVAELARMMAGDDSAVAREHAAQLLAQARDGAEPRRAGRASDRRAG